KQPQQPGYGAPQLGGGVPGHPGRVAKSGGVPPVLNNRGGRPQSAPSPKGLGVPQSLAPRTRRTWVEGGTKGVIRPSDPKSAPTGPPKLDRKRYQRLKENPEVTEAYEMLKQKIAATAPVIDTPEAPRRQAPGPVIGY
ncbi:MAG: hypothetical protein ACRDT4_26145, partial [Micromonosporaceae bacterium]